MQKMIPCLVRRGRTGPQSYRSPELVTCARPLSRATTAAAAERAGTKMSMKSNIEYTKFFRDKIHRNQDHKLRVQASGILRLQAQGPGTQSTSAQAGPGHKLPGHMYSFYA